MAMNGIDSLTESVLGAVFEVSNTLGAGFLEKVYERALLMELGLRGIRATTQASFAVNYKGQSVGEYFADLLVEDELVVELKCAERLGNEQTAQYLNYLRASGRRFCLLVNSRSLKSSGSVSSLGSRFPSGLRHRVQSCRTRKRQNQPQMNTDEHG
jgi:GxxExxY protein